MKDLNAYSIVQNRPGVGDILADFDIYATSFDEAELALNEINAKIEYVEIVEKIEEGTL